MSRIESEGPQPDHGELLSEWLNMCIISEHCIRIVTVSFGLALFLSLHFTAVASIYFDKQAIDFVAGQGPWSKSKDLT